MAFALWRVPLVLVALGIFLPAAQSWLWTTAFLWIGAACTANAFRCGRIHCAIMGPLLLVLGLVSLARTLGVIDLGWNTIGAVKSGIVCNSPSAG